MAAPSNGQNLTVSQLEQIRVFIDAALQTSYQDFQISNANWAKDFIMQGPETPFDYVTFQMINESIGLREGKRGERPKFRFLRGEQLSISVRKWYDAVEVSHHDIQGDYLGMVERRAMECGRGAALLPHDNIIESLKLGATSAYPVADGLPYFDNAHKKGGTTFDNLQTGAFSKTNYQAMRVVMQRFPSDDGAARPIGLKPTHVIHAPDIYIDVQELLDPTNLRYGQGASATNAIKNILGGSAEPIEDPYLTDTNDWYLFCNNYTVKPWIRIQKKGFSPFKTYVEGVNPFEDAFKDEVLRVWGTTYEVTYVTLPELGIKVVN